LRHFGEIANALRQNTDLIQDEKDVVVEGDENATERIHNYHYKRPEKYIKSTIMENME